MAKGVKAFNGEYVRVEALGCVGMYTVELGHYVVDGKAYEDKIYIFEHFTRKSGEEDQRAIAKLPVKEAKALAKLMIKEVE